VSTRSFMLRAVLVVLMVAISIGAQRCLGKANVAVVGRRGICCTPARGRWRRLLVYLTPAPTPLASHRLTGAPSTERHKVTQPYDSIEVIGEDMHA
jgi:hypothetical protein